MGCTLSRQTGHIERAEEDGTSENVALEVARSLKYLFIQASTNSRLFAAALERVFVVSGQAEDGGGVQEGVSSCNGVDETIKTGKTCYIFR